MRFRLVSALFSILLALGGCAPSGSPEPGAGSGSAPSSARAASGTVEVTNYPLAYVVERLVGPSIEVHLRPAEAPDPAYWRPTAEEVVAMQEADLIVVNGAGYERWLEEVSLPMSRLVDTTAGVADRLISVGSTVTHSHGEAGEHTHTGTASTTWLDPTLLIEQVQATEQALTRTWPEHAALFGDRVVDLVKDLEILDEELAAATAGASERPVLFSHPIYQYLARRYDLVGDSLHWEPEEAPDESQWAELERLRDRRGAEWMIWEAEPLPETIERLAEDGVRAVVVDPCATPPDEGDLLTVLHRNAEALRAVYGGEGTGAATD